MILDFDLNTQLFFFLFAVPTNLMEKRCTYQFFPIMLVKKFVCTFRFLLISIETTEPSWVLCACQSKNIVERKPSPALPNSKTLRPVFSYKYDLRKWSAKNPNLKTVAPRPASRSFKISINETRSLLFLSNFAKLKSFLIHGSEIFVSLGTRKS